MAQAVGMGAVEEPMQKSMRFALSETVQINAAGQREAALGELAVRGFIQPVCMRLGLFRGNGAGGRSRLVRQLLCLGQLFVLQSRFGAKGREHPPLHRLGAARDFFPQYAVFKLQKRCRAGSHL
jgi:hypothetical protein